MRRGTRARAVLLVSSAVVAGGFGFSLLACRRHGQSLARRNRELEALARSDDLTGTYNRRHVEEHLAMAVSSARRHRQALSILFVDIDGFKRVNDELGHQVGDAVLRVVAQRIRLALRGEDIVGRWGGEEFLAVLAMTALPGAVAVAERLRSAVASAPATVNGNTVAVTVSIGCAGDHDGDVEALLRDADVALYEAKKGGRNRVGLADERAYGAS